MLAVSLDHPLQAIGGLEGVEQLTVEEDRFAGFADPRFFQTLLPGANLRMRCDSACKLAMHLREDLIPLGRLPRGLIDALQIRFLCGPKQRMAKRVPFALDARHANPDAAGRFRQVPRRGRRAEAGGWGVKMRRDDLMGHLIVAPPADAVDELIGYAKSQE